MKKFVFENSPIFIEKLNNDEVENGHCNDPDDANNKVNFNFIFWMIKTVYFFL